MTSRTNRSISLAYIMSRFPKLTETFILNEILAMESQGVGVEVFPLLREPSRVMHEGALRLARKAHYEPFLSWAILRSNLAFLRRSPRTYLGLLWELMWSALGSANFLVGALAIFPKSVHFAAEMQRLGITHVHAHFANHPAVAALIVGRLTGIPFSFTAHGSDLHVDRHMLREKVAAAHLVATVSEYNKELIVAECGEAVRDKVFVVHCGVDTSEFAPAAGKVAEPLQLLCVASFEEVKGHTHLVSASRILCDRGVAYEFHLVGEGPLRGDIERQVREHGLSPRFRFHGGLPRCEVQRLFSRAHVAVLASVPTRNGKREGIPVALMEAMAAGVPVVASRLSGIPELVADQKSGLLVAPGDANALADAIESLAHRPDLRVSMGAAGRADVMRDFDLQRNAGKLLGLIQSLPYQLTASPAQQPISARLSVEQGNSI